MNLLKNKKTMFFSLLFIATFVISGVSGSQLNSTDSNTITIVYDRLDKVTKETAKEFAAFVSEVQYVNLNGISTGAELKQLTKTKNNPIIYVFHGSDAYWEVGSELISTVEIAAWIDDSPSKTHFMAACYSDVLSQYISPSKFVGGLIGETDQIIGELLIKQMVLNFYKKNNMFQEFVTEKQAVLQDFVRGNPFRVLSLMKNPETPLALIIGSGPEKTVYDSSYYGPSGFYQLSKTSYAYTWIDETLQALHMIKDSLDFIPWLEIGFDFDKVRYTGYAVITTSKVTYEGFYKVTTYSSTKDYADFDVKTVNFEVSLDPVDFKNSLSINPLKDLMKDKPFEFENKAGTPSFTVGGGIHYTSAIHYSNGVGSSYIRYINSFLAKEGYQPNYIQGSLFVQIDFTYKYSITVEANVLGKELDFEVDLFEITASGRIDFSLDSNRNVIIEAGIFGKASIGIDVPLVTIQGKAMLLALALQFNWDSSGFKFAAYGGVYVSFEATIGSYSFNPSIGAGLLYYSNVNSLSAKTLVENYAEKVL